MLNRCPEHLSALGQPLRASSAAARWAVATSVPDVSVHTCRSQVRARSRALHGFHGDIHRHAYMARTANSAAKTSARYEPKVRRSVASIRVATGVAKSAAPNVTASAAM